MKMPQCYITHSATIIQVDLSMKLDVVCRSSPLPGGRSERATDLGGEMKLSEANQCLQRRNGLWWNLTVKLLGSHQYR